MRRSTATQRGKNTVEALFHKILAISRSWPLASMLHVFLFQTAIAQTVQRPPVSTSTFETGAYALESLNLHSANFQTLPGVPGCCPRYERGSGSGLNEGASLAWRFGESNNPAPSFGLELRIGLSNYDATLRTIENSTVILNGQPTLAQFEHTVVSKVRMITMPVLGSYWWDRFGLSFGPSLSYELTNEYSQKEVLQAPQTGTFENGRRIRNESSGSTPGATRLIAAITGGVRYRLPLNQSGNLHLVPEIMGSYSLTALVKGMSWYVNSIGIGVSLQYQFPTAAPFQEPPLTAKLPISEPTVETPHAEPHLAISPQPTITASIRIVTLDSLHAEVPVPELVIEDYIRTQYRPLLNYIFFAEGSSDIPKRYDSLSIAESGSFNYASLNSLETLPLYHELLNIIGKRLQDRPRSRVRIVGCNADIGIERHQTTLSRSRALSVAHYLRTVWGVHPDQLLIESRDLPEKPSSIMDSDGSAENRRVEIYSTDPEILQPVFTTDTAHVAKPGFLRMEPTTVIANSLASWRVVATENTRKLREFSGKHILPDHLDWELDKERESTLRALDTIGVAISVTDTSNRVGESPLSLVPVRHYTLADKHRESSIDTIIARYSLILFDFDRTTLSSANRSIADFVRSRVVPVSHVVISGYTDRIGTDDYNRQLSLGRAKAAYDYLAFPPASVQGIGRSILLYDNTLPEGRFYSRTVTIVVSTPVRE